MWILAFLYCDLCLPARPSYPVLDVKVRSEDRDIQLSAAEIKVKGVPALYAAHRPKPFTYLSDTQPPKKGGGVEKQPFLVAGVNCDRTLKAVPTITGVEVDILSQRGRPGNGAPESDPAWNGINNRAHRSSIDGFLKVGQPIRDVLLKDNATVRAAGLTHQQVASPALATMEEVAELVEQGKDWDPDSGFEMAISGTQYRVKVNNLGTVYFPGLRYDDNMNRVRDEDMPRVRAAARKKAKSYRTGWTGAGIQGSPFQDELYSSCSLTFSRPDGKQLTVDCLTPHLIYRYGFYQGGPYRQEPEALIHFFNLKPTDEAKELWNRCGVQ